MICKYCRGQGLPDQPPLHDLKLVEHSRCPEVARQERLDADAVELAGSAWCDCQHVPPRPVPGEGGALTLDK